MKNPERNQRQVNNQLKNISNNSKIHDMINHHLVKSSVCYFQTRTTTEYNTMVGVDTDTLTAPTSNFNKRMLREKEPETRLEQMANLKYDPVAPE